MSKEVLERWMPTTVAELREALDQMVALAADEMGSRVDVEDVYVDLRDLALVRSTLTDGSVAFDIVVRENR
jgi:hypothetical protein